MGFTFRAEGIKVGVATDLGYLPVSVRDHLRGCDVLVMESNHDLEMLRVGPYPWSVKQRVMSRVGHLSNLALADFFTNDYDNSATFVVLAHLSEKNNHPEIARREAEKALADAGWFVSKPRACWHRRPRRWSRSGCSRAGLLSFRRSGWGFHFRILFWLIYLPMSQQCIDPIVGKILAGWRYDISGLAPEMCGDYESHFAACEHCRSRQQIHRIIDVGLIALASISAAVFLLAFGVIRHLGPRHAFWLEIAALAGFALSALIWLGVAVATPAPVTVLDAAKEGARRVHDRLPEEIRQRLPEELRIKITGT